jgi:hypothetical protein
LGGILKEEASLRRRSAVKKKRDMEINHKKGPNGSCIFYEYCSILIYTSIEHFEYCNTSIEILQYFGHPMYNVGT